jgi:replicative DNA helicase
VSEEQNPMNDDVDLLEARALSGMFVHRRLSVPSTVFAHEGRRFMVADWEQHGIDRYRCMERLAKVAPMHLVQDADADIDAMSPLVETIAVWESACEELNRRHRTGVAAADADRAVQDYQRNPSAATAAAAANAFQRVTEANAPEIRAPSGVELFDSLMADAVATQGREFLGIKFPSLPKLNGRMDGLRGLTFMGGSPGTGKTSLALQMAWNAAVENPDTVVLFVTCEMSAKEVQASLITQRAVIPFDQLMKGKPGKQPAANGMMLTEGDIANLEKARRDIAALGDRWRIVQPSDFGGAFVGSKRGGAGVFAPVTAMANRAKQASGAERMLVVVDSLQRVPVAEPVSGSVTGWMGEAIERDNYVVDALNALASGTGDAVMCITEQNKAQQGTASITSMRGTGSIGYACDNALMLTDPEDYDKDAGEATRKRHYAEGYRLVEAHLTKGRQGSKRGSELLRFDIHTHSFREGAEAT